MADVLYGSGDMDTSSEWTMSDMLDELRGKYHLKFKDAETYRERTHEEQRENERIIASLRQENWNKRIILAQHENGDEAVIKSVFDADEDQLKRLSLQRYTASTAINEMDQKVCEGGKVLNMLRYGRELRQNKLQELQEELDRMIYLHINSPDQNEAEHRINILENAMDKATIKYETARNLSRRYQDIKDNLKEESLTLPAKLDAMEQALLVQQSDLADLRKLSKDAVYSREVIRKELTVVEQQLYETRKQRDAVLKQTKKEVESRQAEAEKVQRRHARNNFSTTEADQGRIKRERELMYDSQKKSLNCEEAFRTIREATNVFDMDEVMLRMQCQTEKLDHLKKRVSDLETQRERLNEEMAKLKKLFHDMKYSGEQNISRGQSVLTKLNDLVEEEELIGSRASDELERGANTLVDIRAGVTSLLNKLDEVKLRPPEHNHTDGDVFQQMALCWKKMEHLLSEVGEVTRKSSEPQLQCPKFQEFLEDRLPADNVRVVIMSGSEKGTSMSDFEYGNGMHEGDAPTREDIKRMGKVIIDSKINPKKRRRDKK